MSASLGTTRAESEYLTMAATSRLLDVSLVVVKALIENGELKPRNYPKTRRILRRSDVLALKAQREPAA